MGLLVMSHHCINHCGNVVSIFILAVLLEDHFVFIGKPVLDSCDFDNLESLRQVELSFDEVDDLDKNRVFVGDLGDISCGDLFFTAWGHRGQRCEAIFSRNFAVLNDDEIVSSAGLNL